MGTLSFPCILSRGQQPSDRGLALWWIHCWHVTRSLGRRSKRPACISWLCSLILRVCACSGDHAQARWDAISLLVPFVLALSHIGSQYFLDQRKQGSLRAWSRCRAEVWFTGRRL